MSVLGAAIAYARVGWPVLPVHSWRVDRCSCRKGPACPHPAKHPIIGKWQQEAITNETKLEEWWWHWPDANVGLLTGVGFDVLDIDSVEAFDRLWVASGHDGVPSLDILTGGSPIVRTPRGWHCHMAPTGRPGGTEIGGLDGVDWRAKGGFVVAPPSSRQGLTYEWMTTDTRDQPPAPDWLLALLPQARSEGPVQPSAAPVLLGRGYGAAALRGECERMADAPEGARNDTLNRSAFALGQLVVARALTANEAGEALLHVVLLAGLTEDEAIATIRSGLESGIEQPRGQAS
jgi:hypothetical protein